MTPSPTRLLLALACCLAFSPAMAAKVTKVEVTGLADEVMEDNVRSALSLSDELDKDITARRLNYLLRQAEAVQRGEDPAGVSFDPDAAPVFFDAGNFMDD